MSNLQKPHHQTVVLVRVSEALKLTYGDVDFANRRVRISKARTKGGTAGQRWLPVPQELLDEIADLVPLGYQHRDRLVFPRLTDNQGRFGGLNMSPSASLVWSRCGLKSRKRTSMPLTKPSHHFKKPSEAHC